MSVVGGSESKLSIYHYNKFNQLTDDYGGSVTASYTYNADNELGKEFRITGIQILHCFLTNILTVNKEILEKNSIKLHF